MEGDGVLRPLEDLGEDEKGGLGGLGVGAKVERRRKSIL